MKSETSARTPDAGAAANGTADGRRPYARPTLTFAGNLRDARGGGAGADPDLDFVSYVSA
ncbi:MAG: hypothetical protein JW751_29755 [Polyangiaceae bacterium]|nr:hypothetical protein [Polyangiaceae bacterium]